MPALPVDARHTVDLAGCAVPEQCIGCAVAFVAFASEPIGALLGKEGWMCMEQPLHNLSGGRPPNQPTRVGPAENVHDAELGRAGPRRCR